jgi:hypothetical protein
MRSVSSFPLFSLIPSPTSRVAATSAVAEFGLGALTRRLSRRGA